MVERDFAHAGTFVRSIKNRTSTLIDDMVVLKSGVKSASGDLVPTKFLTHCEQKWRSLNLVEREKAGAECDASEPYRKRPIPRTRAACGARSTSPSLRVRSCRNTSGIASGHAYPRQADCEGVALRAMQIFVKPMPGPDRHQLAPSGRVLIDVMPWDTVKDVKAKIQVRMGPLYYQRFDEDWDVPAALQSLYYIDIDGEPVSLQLDHATLRDYRIQHGDTLELRWAGGCDNRPVEREEEEQKAEEEEQARREQIFLAARAERDAQYDEKMKETEAQRMHDVAREFRRRRRAEGTSPVILCGCDAALFPDEVREDKEQRQASANDKNDENDKNDKNDGQDKTTARTPARSRSRATNPPSVRIRSRGQRFAADCRCWLCSFCAPLQQCRCGSVGRCQSIMCQARHR
jgi:hypothetical protein